jgi:hypothetical protein
MFTTGPTASAEGENCGPTVFVTKGSVGSANFPSFTRVNRSYGKVLSVERRQPKRNHCDRFTLNNIFWLK